MNRLIALLTVIAIGLAGQQAAHAYSATANVTFAWAEAGTQIGWTSSAANLFPDPATPNLQVFAQSGNNSTSYFNPDFAVASDYGAGTGDDCLTLLSPSNPTPDGNAGYDTITLRKYACRQQDDSLYYDTVYNPVPVTDASNGGAATGTLSVSDTTLTGTLTVVSTTDEPTGATTTIVSGVRTSTSVGDGFDGYNIRTADGSPFGNVWYGITTTMTLAVNLTGTFTATDWDITGGAVTFNDPNLACAQGGPGTQTLCNPSTSGGGFTPTGGHLSWGMDTDGAGTGTTVATPIDVRDQSGATTIATLGGVLADLSVAGGTITTTLAEYRIGSGSINNGCATSIRWGGDTDVGVGTAIGISCGTLAAGPLTITGTATEIIPDADPDAFSFTAQTDVAVSTAITSNTVTISGINTAAPISVTNGQYSVGCTGTFTSSAATINDGQTVCVRQTSSASFGTLTTATLTIGAVSGDFDVTTVAADTDPNAFTFASQTGVARSTAIASAAASISGINTAAPISVANGEYSIGCLGIYTSSAGTINAGNTVCVRHTSAAGFSADTVTTLTIGTVAGTFTSTTLAQDTTPNAFSFPSAANVALSTPTTSNSVAIGGINSPAAISVSGGSEYSIGCTTFTSTAGTISDGQSVCVRHTSSAAFDTDVVTTLTIGGVNGTFTSTTLDADTTPNLFDFVNQNDVEVDTVITSAAITVAGINSAAAISVTGGTYSIGCGADPTYTAVAGTIALGETVCVRHTSSDQPNESVDTTLTIGGISDTFTSTTAGGGLREDDGGSSLDALLLALLGLGGLARRRIRR